MKELVVATRNKDKAREIRHILSGIRVRILTLDDFNGMPDIVEDGDTFEYNAAKKARLVSKYTGRLALADDSGLVVKALGGMPGVKSARFAGPRAAYLENNLKLLSMLGGLPLEKRAAKFICTIAIADKGKVLKIVSGSVEGHIGFVMRGDNGFGYDPLFVGKRMAKTFGEIGPGEKNRISHRYLALMKARVILSPLLKG